MILLVAVDPGKTHAGWAEFVDGTLTRCGIVRDLPGPTEVAHAVAAESGLLQADVVIAEGQQVYSFGKGDPNDLIPLAMTSGGILALTAIDTIRCNPLPRKWKGTTKKEIMTLRIENRLRPEESAVLAKLKTTKKYRVDVLDAIGLGLHYLNRL